MFCPPCGPTLEEPSLVSRDDLAAVGSPMANTRPSITSADQNLAPPVRVVEPPCLAPRATPTISEARALSARCLYALKWPVAGVQQKAIT